MHASAFAWLWWRVKGGCLKPALAEHKGTALHVADLGLPLLKGCQATAARQQAVLEPVRAWVHTWARSSWRAAKRLRWLSR